MNKRLFLSAVCYCITTSLFTQVIVKNNNRPAYKNAIFLKPLNGVDYSHPRISIGYEYMFKNKVFLSLTTSCYIQNYYETKRQRFFRDLPFMPTRGIAVDFEYKKFQRKLFYYAGSLTLGSIIYQATNIFINRLPDGTSSEDLNNFNVKKKWVEAAAKIGWRTRTTDRLFFDFYLGVGLRLKYTNHFETSARPNSYIEKVENIYYYRDRPGSFFLPVLKAGIVVGLKY